MKNIAIILASGKGSRFESKLPRQFVRLAGKPVIPCSRRINSVDVTEMSSLTTVLSEIRDGYMVNYVGVIDMAKAAFIYLKESRGMLINFSSSSYTRERSNYSIYSSSKAAIVNFTQAIAEEWLHPPPMASRSI